MSQQEPAKEPMICSKCGATMNCHAEKVDYSLEDSRDDPVFGGPLEEVHTCPHCGHIQLRKPQ